MVFSSPNSWRILIQGGNLKLPILKWLSEVDIGIDTRQFNMSALETPQRTTNEAVTRNPNLLPFIVWTHLLSGILGLSFHLQENKTLRSRRRGSDQTESARHRATTNRASARESREKGCRPTVWHFRSSGSRAFGRAPSGSAGSRGWVMPPSRTLRSLGWHCAAEQHALHAPWCSRVQHFLALVHSDYLRIFTLVHGI